MLGHYTEKAKFIGNMEATSQENLSIHSTSLEMPSQENETASQENETPLEMA